MSAPELHVAGVPDRDGQDCCRCHAVLSQQAGGPFAPGEIVSMPSGHWSDARSAETRERATGVLCKAKPKTHPRIDITIDGWIVKVLRGESTVALDGIGGRFVNLTLDEARALCQALRECIGAEDVPAMVEEARRWVNEPRARVEPLPAPPPDHDWTGYPLDIAEQRARLSGCPCAGCRAARATT